MCVGPTNWPTQVYVDDDEHVRFLPQHLTTPPKTHWMTEDIGGKTSHRRPSAFHLIRAIFYLAQSVSQFAGAHDESGSIQDSPETSDAACEVRFDRWVDDTGSSLSTLSV
eukprot:jgi/Tetstr1/439531/TSEL_027960.t1